MKQISSKPNFQVVLMSGLILFLELFLIRFLPSQILYFGYFTNFVLIASFLGIGLGFLFANKKKNLVNYFPIALLILFACSWIFSTGLFLDDNDLIFFRDSADYQPIAIPSLILLPIFFMLVSAVFLTLSQFLARLFASSVNPLKTYIFDILGSILGIVFFFLLSVLGLGPLVWLLVVVCLYLFLIPQKPSQIIFSIVLFLLCFLFTFSFNEGQTFWSPYYKITFLKQADTGGGLILANNIHHQQFSDTKHSTLHSSLMTILRSQTTFEDVLIIGSGSGQDVNAALQAGAKRIDAVEIDPIIYQIGKNYHPEKPYQDPRVRVVINDGRNFLKETDKKYDLIIFALTDSLILNSGIGEVRLESYLFTKESFAEARLHLKDKGIFVLYNDYRKDWLINRFDQMLRQEFSGQVKQIPLFGLTGGHSVKMFIAHNSNLPVLSNRRDSVSMPTDDWPFLYLKTPSIPFFYISNLLLISFISVIALYFAIRHRQVEIKSHFPRLLAFFFLGAAFSLVETKSIVQLSLLFGSTWQVFCLAFIGILLTVFFAALLSAKVKFRSRAILFGVLFLSLAVQYFLPINQLLLPELIIRYLVAILYFYMPIFIANLLFASFFDKSKLADLDFGFNILGLVLGGVLEYLALITGYANLTIVILICYLVVYLFSKYHSQMN